MTKFIVGGFIAVLVLIVAVLVVLFTGVKVTKDSEGFNDISILWGLVKVNEKTKKVSVMGDFVNVDGINEKVNVAGVVKVDGKANIVDINNGDIIVEGDKGLMKVKRNLVVEIKEDRVLLDPNYKENLLKSALKITITNDKDIELKGRVIGTDDVYLHLEVEKSDVKVKVEL